MIISVIKILALDDTDFFYQGLQTALPNVIRNGDAVQTYNGCVNLSFHCVEGESLLMALKVIFIYLR